MDINKDSAVMLALVQLRNLLCAMTLFILNKV